MGLGREPGPARVPAVPQGRWLLLPGRGARRWSGRHSRGGGRLPGGAAERFSKVLVQGYVAGRGVGAFFLIWDGRVWPSSSIGASTKCPTPGATRHSARATHTRPSATTLAKIHALSCAGSGCWSTVSTNRPATSTLSSSTGFWGSLHLALFARVDFPTLLLDAFHGRPQAAPKYRLGVRCRNTFPDDVQYVWSRLKDRRLSRGARAWSVLEFALLSLDPRVRNDLLYPGDRRLWLSATRRARQHHPNRDSPDLGKPSSLLRIGLLLGPAHDRSREVARRPPRHLLTPRIAPKMCRVLRKMMP